MWVLATKGRSQRTGVSRQAMPALVLLLRGPVGQVVAMATPEGPLPPAEDRADQSAVRSYTETRTASLRDEAGRS